MFCFVGITEEQMRNAIRESVANIGVVMPMPSNEADRQALRSVLEIQKGRHLNALFVCHYVHHP